MRSEECPRMAQTTGGVAAMLEAPMQADSNTREIPLTQGRVALVDAADEDDLLRWKWCAHRHPNGRWYAVRGERRDGTNRLILMHRHIMNPPAGLDVDHANRDGLDNRRDNLRVATRTQNIANGTPYGVSPYRGVCWCKQHAKWKASARSGGVVRHAAFFDDAVEAALSYDLVAMDLFGEFARPNFLVRPGRP